MQKNLVLSSLQTLYHVWGCIKYFNISTWLFEAALGYELMMYICQLIKSLPQYQGKLDWCQFQTLDTCTHWCLF